MRACAQARPGGHARGASRIVFPFSSAFACAGCQTDAAIQIERNSLQQHRRDRFRVLMPNPQEPEKEVTLSPGLHNVFGSSQTANLP